MKFTLSEYLVHLLRSCRDWSGKVSIVAHSLGAIICFDIMANQPAPKAPQESRGVSPSGDTSVNVPAVPATPPTDREGFDVNSREGRGEHAAGGEERVSGVEDGEDGGLEEGKGGTDEAGGDGCLRYYRGSTKFPALSVQVENVFCLGSPIGMFLMIRGQHRRLGKSFKLPG